MADSTQLGKDRIASPPIYRTLGIPFSVSNSRQGMIEQLPRIITDVMKGAKLLAQTDENYGG